MEKSDPGRADTVRRTEDPHGTCGAGGQMSARGRSHVLATSVSCEARNDRNDVDQRDMNRYLQPTSALPPPYYIARMLAFRLKKKVASAF